MTSDVDEWFSLAKSVIEDERTCFEAVRVDGLTTTPVNALQNSHVTLEATLAKLRRKDALARLKELASKCSAVALGRLSRTEFAACSRDLDAVVSAIAELQKWDDFGEFSREGFAKFGSNLVNPLNRVAVYRERFEPRLNAAEAAIKSDALQVLKAIADLPVECGHQTGEMGLALAKPTTPEELIVTGSSRDVGNTSFVAAKATSNVNHSPLDSLKRLHETDPPNELLDKLKNQNLKLLKFLWTQRYGVDWKSLPRDAFRAGDDRSDEAVEKALRRLQTELNKLDGQFQIQLVISAETRRVKLEKPLPTNADK